MRLRIMALIAAIVLLVGTAAAADSTFLGFQIVRIMLNGQEVETDVPAILVNGRTLLPVRRLAELTGMNIDRWDGETNTVYLSKTGLGEAVASVNGEVITQLDLYNQLIGQDGASILDELIQERLVDQAARQAGVVVTEAEIDQAVAEIRGQFGSEEQFLAALRSYSITVEQLRRDQAFSLKVTRLLTPSIPVDDTVLAAFFTANSTQFDQRTVHARHILLSTEQEAQAVKEQLAAGADFAALAKEKSTDPSAQTNGGDLGTFGAGVMVAEFERVVFSLAEGEVSEPFQSPFGWHIAQVLVTQGEAPDFAALKDVVRELYLEEQVAERAGDWLAELRAKAQVRNMLELR